MSRKHKAPQFDLPLVGEEFALVGEALSQVEEPVVDKAESKRLRDLFERELLTEQGEGL